MSVIQILVKTTPELKSLLDNTVDQINAAVAGILNTKSGSSKNKTSLRFAEETVLGYTPGLNPFKSDAKAEDLVVNTALEHPKAKAARLENEAKAKRHELYAAEVEQALSFGYNFLVVGDTTVCYKNSGDFVAYIATALRNKKDRWSRTEGKARAWERMKSGVSIPIKRIPHETASSWPMSTFSQVKRMFEG